MSHEIYLFVALAVMAIGPLLVTLLKRVAWSSTILDGFVFASIAGIVLFHILPESISTLGWISFVIAAAGLFTPNLIERASAFRKISAHSAIILGLLAIMIHTWLDGVAIGATHSVAGGSALSIAIILHRLPVGVGLWWLIRPRWGKRGAWIVIAMLSASTVTGFIFAPFFAQYMQHSILMGLQTFVAGTLFHVILHDAFESKHSERWAELVGVALGALVIIAIPFLDPHDHSHSENTAHYGDTFLDLMIASAPALLLGYFLAGLMAVFIPKMPINWLNRGSNFSKAFKGTAIGLPVPVCSCGVVPLYKGLIKSGVGAPAAMAFMVATPELGLDAILLSIPLLGTELTIARIVGAFSVAILVGLFVGSKVKSTVQEQETAEKFSMPMAPHWTSVVYQKGFVEIVDETAPWILLGIGIAAFFGPGASLEFISNLPPYADVFIFALVGIPIYVCASGSTPLAAALIFAGASPGAALAFLLAGPATNVTTFGILTQMHSKRVSFFFGAAVVMFSIIAGLTTNIFLADSTFGILENAHAHDISIWQWVALSLLLLIFVGSVIRLGPRGFIANLSPGGGHRHAHDDHNHENHDPHDSGCGSGSCC